ncbi:hypothetical protein BKA62DRAFT_695357 [Auriculariales sp. MPI-PUGE-AT-0066]|nr:hypothetical protein BKA62DRAFT_695357 [Auriculariales sp. MPI-PUGE-AT-0066]
MPDTAVLSVFSFFALREFIVAPILSVLSGISRNTTTGRASRQLTKGIIHSAIAGALANVIARGEPPSSPPDYRSWAMTFGQLSAIAQFGSNAARQCFRPRQPAPIQKDEPNASPAAASKGLDEGEADKINGIRVFRFTGLTYLAVVMFGLVIGQPVPGALIGLPAFLLIPVFFWQRDYVIGTILDSLATPESRALARTSRTRWTRKMFESTLAGAFTGYCAAMCFAYMNSVAKRLNNDANTVIYDSDSQAMTGAQFCAGCQFLVNMYRKWRAPATIAPKQSSKPETGMPDSSEQSPSAGH